MSATIVNLGNLTTRTGKVVHAPDANGSERAHTLCKPYGSMYRARPGMNYDITYYVSRGSVTCKPCLKAIAAAYELALTEDVAWTDHKAHRSERDYYLNNSAMDIYHMEALEMETARVARVTDSERLATATLSVMAEVRGMALVDVPPAVLVARISGASEEQVTAAIEDAVCAWPWQSVQQSRNGVLLAAIKRLWKQGAGDAQWAPVSRGPVALTPVDQAGAVATLTAVDAPRIEAPSRVSMVLRVGVPERKAYRVSGRMLAKTRKTRNRR